MLFQAARNLPADIPITLRRRLDRQSESRAHFICNRIKHQRSFANHATHEHAMILNRVAATVLALAASVSTVPAAEVTVKMLHVEQNPQASGFWQEIARKYMADHPGVKIELRYLENEAYKKKLTTLLQSPDRPNIIYSWAGGVLREQVKAGVIADLSADMSADWRQRFNPVATAGLYVGRQDLRRADADLPGRLLLQQGPVRESRRRRGRDQDMGRSARGSQAAESGGCDPDHRRWRRQVADPLLLDLPRDAQRRQACLRGSGAR